MTFFCINEIGTMYQTREGIIATKNNNVENHLTLLDADDHVTDDAGTDTVLFGEGKSTAPILNLAFDLVVNHLNI